MNFPKTPTKKEFEFFNNEKLHKWLKNQLLFDIDEDFDMDEVLDILELRILLSELNINDMQNLKESYILKLNSFSEGSKRYYLENIAFLDHSIYLCMLDTIS
jgi:hypothetical protein